MLCTGLYEVDFLLHFEEAARKLDWWGPQVKDLFQLFHYT